MQPQGCEALGLCCVHTVHSLAGRQVGLLPIGLPRTPATAAAAHVAVGLSVMRVGGRARRGARQKQARGVAGAPVVTRLCRGPLSTIATEAVASGGASRGTGHVVMRGVGRLGRRDAPNPPLPPLSPLNKPLHP